MTKLKTGDLFVVTTPEGTAKLAVLHVCPDGRFLLGDDPDSGVPFAPLPYIFEVPFGAELIGASAPMPIISVKKGGAIEVAARYNDLLMRRHEAEKFETSDEEYDMVEELNQDIANLVAAFTLYPGFIHDSTSQAAAILAAIGIPIPDREKLILLGTALEYVYMNALNECLPEDDEDEASRD